MNRTMQTKRLLPLGRLVITCAAGSILEQEDVDVAIKRHTVHDWGDVCDDDSYYNNAAVKTGGRILSSYKDRHGMTFWIITEADRSYTTVLPPEDY